MATSQPFTIRNSWGLDGGLAAVDAILTNVSSLDTVNFQSTFSKIQGIAVVNPTNAVPGITGYAASTYASLAIITLPSGASFSGDNMDIIVTGPAIGTTIPGGPLQ